MTGDRPPATRRGISEYFDPGLPPLSAIADAISGPCRYFDTESRWDQDVTQHESLCQELRLSCVVAATRV